MLVIDIKRLKKAYRSTNQFIVDVLSIFPTDLAFFYFGLDFIVLRYVFNKPHPEI